MPKPEDRKKEIEEVKKVDEEAKIMPFGNKEHIDTKFQGGKEKQPNIK
jgi:hypothetical protein